MLKMMWKSLYKEKSKNTEAILKENILFQDLNPRELKLVMGTVHIRDYRTEEVIFHQGQTGFGMYIIENGNIKISHKKDPLSDEEEETTLAVLQAGDFFGELALVEEGGKRSASAKALSDTKLIGFFKPNLLDIIERSPRAGVKIALRLNEVLGKRLIETNNTVTMLNEKMKALQGGDKN